MIKGTHLSEESREKISKSLKGIIRSPETRLRMSNSKKGIVFSKSHIENLSKSHIGLPGNPHTPESRAKIAESHKREKAWNWRGGLRGLNYGVRRSAKYKEWRNDVYKRDNYTCRFCGKAGGRLNADHIKPFAEYPELRFELSNGRTLCVPCHTKTPTYGWNRLHARTVSGSI